MTTRRSRRSVRFGDAEWGLIEAAAAVAETHASSFIRRSALEAAENQMAEQERTEAEPAP